MASNPVTYLNDVKPENYFYLKDKIIKNIKELLKVLQKIDDSAFKEFVNEEKNDFYNWIKYSVKDEKLAYKIRNLKLKKNMIDKIKQRIVFLENVKYGKDETEIIRELKLYVNTVVLKLEKEICIGCETCSLVCPVEAIRVEKNNVSIDRKKCLICGLCDVFCPVDALKCSVDGKEKNTLIEKQGLPRLPEPESIRDLKIRKSFDGIIHINYEKCPNDCEECISACPLGLIKRKKGSVTVEDDDCVLCGACKNSCPNNLIIIKRNMIRHGDGFSSAWLYALEKLTSKEKMSLEQEERSRRKLKDLMIKSGIKI